MLKRIIFTILIVCASGPHSIWSADKFAKIKSELKTAGCVRLEFLSILHSSIFRQIDTSRGTALIARDGRYRVTLGTDQFLNDARHLYSYSQENAQVIVEEVDSSIAFSKEVSYITRLDDFFETYVDRAGSAYRLVRTAAGVRNIPDSLRIALSRGKDRIERFEYRDINCELVSIVLERQELRETCDDREFEPDFPDSVERVKL